MDKILFFGAGNMGQSIINGIISKKLVTNNNIFFYEINPRLRQEVAKKYKINALEKIDEKIKDFDVIVLAVKPTIFLNFKKDDKMHKLAGLVKEHQVVVSIMAGVTIEEMQDFFVNDPQIIRTMPNTPALVGEAMTVICRDEKVTDASLTHVKNIFSSIGKVEVLEEKFLNAVTGLSGSGPAYVFMFIEALIQGGVLCGLPRDVSQRLIVQTVLGSAKMMDGDKTVEELRHAVTTPGGTTIEALTILENNGFRGIVADAVRAATEKSRKLSIKT